MECSQVQEKLSCFLDGALDEATLEAVEAHLDCCEECREELEALRAVVDLTSSVLEVEPPAFLSSAIKDAVARERQAEEACAEYATMLSAYVDGELSATERETVDVHVSGCSGCAEELAVLKATVASMELVREVAPPASLRGRIAAATTGSRRLAPVESIRRWFETLSAPRLGWAAGIAAAAACVVALVSMTSHQPAEPTKVAVKVDRPAPVAAEAPKTATTTEVTTSPKPVQAEMRNVVDHRRIRVAVAPRTVSPAKRVVAPKRTVLAAKVKHPAAEPVMTDSITTNGVIDADAVDDAGTVVAVSTGTEPPVEMAEAPKSSVIKLSLSAIGSAKDLDNYFKDIKLSVQTNRRSSDGIRVDVISKRF